MKFSQWLENQDLEARAAKMPASAGVLRSGLQPQVNSQETQTAQKDHFNKIQKVAKHMDRIKYLVRGIDEGDFKKTTGRILDMWKAFLSKPQDTAPGVPELQNQLPAGPGTLGVS